MLAHRSKWAVRSGREQLRQWLGMLAVGSQVRGVAGGRQAVTCTGRHPQRSVEGHEPAPTSSKDAPVARSPGSGAGTPLRLTVIPPDASVRPHVPAPARSTATTAQRSFREMAAEMDPLLYACALRLCRNPVEARDLVQDAFECGLRDFAQVRPGSNTRGWLTTILYNRFMDRCRARSREPQRAEMEQVAEEHPAEEPRLEEAWERVTFEELLEAVERLEEPFREVYRMAALHRQSYKAISTALGIPVATVGTRLLRARARLRSLLLKEVER